MAVGWRYSDLNIPNDDRQIFRPCGPWHRRIRMPNSNYSAIALGDNSDSSIHQVQNLFIFQPTMDAEEFRKAGYQAIDQSRQPASGHSLTVSNRLL